MDNPDVRHYYDRNTRRFVALGQGDGAIHRAVWGPGVTARAGAMQYVDDLVAERVAALPVARFGASPHVVDLGCGVGASLCTIAGRLPVRGTGVTISPVQRKMAAAHIAAMGLDQRLRCLEGDFCALPDDLEPAALAFAVEAFVHAPEPDAFFREAARLVRPGGRLIICDDFLATRELTEQRRARRWLRRFRRGWHIGSLLTPEDADALAVSHGFMPAERIDLSGYLELGRPRDLAIAALMRALGALPVPGRYWPMLRGGHALQVCLKRGWLKYEFMVWENPA